MEFPETFEEFAKEYGFKDNEEVYTNGSDLIPIFRVKQWLEHDNKLCRIETDTAYECGKHANKWIPVSERLPEQYKEVIVTDIETSETYLSRYIGNEYWECDNGLFKNRIIAWQPKPQSLQGRK